MLLSPLLAQDAWLSKPNLNSGFGAPSARGDCVAVWTGSRLIVWGGRNGGTTHYADGGSYDPVTDTWESKPGLGSASNAPPPTAIASAVWTGTHMLVWSGLREPVPPQYLPPYWYNTGALYNPATDAWSFPSNLASGLGAPSPRVNPQTIWTGERAIAMGGYAGTVIWGGGTYTPSLDSWSAGSSAVFAPGNIHFSQGLVYTGEFAIAWGGARPDAQSPSGFVSSNLGAVIRSDGEAVLLAPNLATGLGAPSPRSAFAAAWTGIDYVVWGGGFAANDGGVYRPAIETWLQKPNLSAGTGAPMGRTFEDNRTGGRWTGSRFLIWGGVNGVNAPTSIIYYNNGGQYDPKQDSWDSLPVLNSPLACPLARLNHNVVWCGDRMIVWGGVEYQTSNQNSLTNSGHIYVPPPVAPSIESTPKTTAAISQPYKSKIVVYSTPYSTITTSTLPNWLTLSVAPSNGAWGTGIYGNIAYLEGTPPASELNQAYTIMIMAGNGIGTNATQTFTLTVTDPPVFTTTPPASITGPSLYTYTPAAIGTPNPTITCGQLPAWLAWNGTTLSGTPASADIGTSPPITLTASNGLESATQTFTVDVLPVAPALSLSPPSFANPNVHYAGAVVASGFPEPTITLTNLPAWLSLNGTNVTQSGSTAQSIFGTPTATMLNQVFTFTATIDNGIGVPVVETITITVIPVRPAHPAMIDVNGDSVIDVVDIQAVVNVILALSPQTTMPHPVNPPPATALRGDVTLDGFIDVVDIQALVNHILGL